jgi:hypothetical protein
MSVEKLSDSSQVTSEKVPFAQISNFVIEHIKDNDAFRIWAFSFSKSTDWKVIKDFTQKICGVGERKSEYVWSYLNRCGLVEYERIVDKKTGKYIKMRIKILNGTKFNPHEPFLKEKTTPAKNGAMDATTPALSAAAVSAAAEMTPLLKKDITNKEEPNKKSSYTAPAIKSVTAKAVLKKINSEKHAFADSMDQMSNETKAIAESEQYKIRDKQPAPNHIREEITKALGRSYGLQRGTTV